MKKINMGNYVSVDIIKDMVLKDRKRIFDSINMPEIVPWLESIGYFNAPASAQYHGSHEGGLYEHSWRVAEYLSEISSALEYKWDRWQSPFIIGLLHDVCKCDEYKATKEGYERNDETRYLGHGDKSLIILMGHADLTEEEKMCIRYHMGAYTDKKEWSYYGNAVRECSGVLLTHMADMLASHVDDM